MHYPVHTGLLSGSTGSFKRPGRSVHPYIDSLYHSLGKIHIIVGNEYYLSYELRHLRYFNDILDQILSEFVCRMRFAGKEELNGTLRIVDDCI